MDEALLVLNPSGSLGRPPPAPPSHIPPPFSIPVFSASSASHLHIRDSLSASSSSVMFSPPFDVSALGKQREQHFGSRTCADDTAISPVPVQHLDSSSSNLPAVSYTKTNSCHSHSILPLVLSPHYLSQMSPLEEEFGKHVALTLLLLPANIRVSIYPPLQKSHDSLASLTPSVHRKLQLLMTYPHLSFLNN